jgi:hypothetical protein
MGVYRSEALTEVFLEPATRRGRRVLLHMGRIQDGGGGGIVTNKGAAVRIERMLVCGVQEIRYQDTREVAVNTQRYKISHTKWEKADARVQAGGEYAYTGQKLVC